jgi:hypothetical protein
MAQPTTLAQRVSDIYDWLEAQLEEQPHLAGTCRMCGKCCDFDSYDHRLFITTPEIEYLTEKIGRDNIKPMTNGRCPYNLNGLCTIHQSRFAACRIFCCQGDKDFQNNLSEATLVKLKTICDEFNVPYQYLELPTALNSFTG